MPSTCQTDGLEVVWKGCELLGPVKSKPQIAPAAGTQHVSCLKIQIFFIVTGFYTETMNLSAFEIDN